MHTSLIVVNYNGWDDLERCLRSVLDDPAQPDEIIVVDNASSDGSPVHISAEFPFVQLIKSAENLGFAGGCNLGADRAQGSFLVFLNPDTVVTPGWLAPLISPFESNPEVGLTTPKILLLEQPELVNACGNEFHLTGLTLCRGLGRPADAFSRQKWVAAVSGAAFAIRKELFKSLGGLDEAFFLYMEDTDLSLRVQLAGYHCLFVPESLIYHDYRLSFRNLKTFFQERNRYLTLLKLYRIPTMILLAPALLLAEVITWGFVFLREESTYENKLNAYRWIWRHHKQVREKRQVAQATRKTADHELLKRTNTWLELHQTKAGWIPYLVEFFFNPLFTILKWLLLIIVWW